MNLSTRIHGYLGLSKLLFTALLSFYSQVGGVLYVEMLELPEAPTARLTWGMRRLRGPPDSDTDPLVRLEYGPSDPVTGIREKVLSRGLSAPRPVVAAPFLQFACVLANLFASCLPAFPPIASYSRLYSPRLVPTSRASGPTYILDQSSRLTTLVLSEVRRAGQVLIY